MRRSYHVLLTCMRLITVVLLLAFPSWALAAAEDAGAPAASSSGASTSGTTDVKVRDKVIVTFVVARGDRSPVVRAKDAQAALDPLLLHSDQLNDVHFEETNGTAVIFVGKTPVITLGPTDAEERGESLNVLAAQVTSRLSDAASSERKRSAIATTVFSVSLLVFSALIAFWLLGRASELADRLRNWMTEHPERLAAIKLGKIEVVSAGAARGGSTILLTLGYRFIQIAIGYAWIIFALSLFESTRGYTEKLTGFIVAPLYALAARIGSSLPVAIIAGIAVLAVSILVRFVGLFFDSVARGDTRIALVPRDLARARRACSLRAAISRRGARPRTSPLITGESDGALARVGLVALIAVALASTPLYSRVRRRARS